MKLAQACVLLILVLHENCNGMLILKRPEKLLLDIKFNNVVSKLLQSNTWNATNVKETIDVINRHFGTAISSAGVDNLDPDFYRDSKQLIESKGYQCDVHNVITDDGFNLTMFRIPAKVTNATKLPVFLMHGLLSSSDCYLNNNINESLAYILANRGYDVWLGNVRGNRYSENHIKYNIYQRKFWEWSFDEMGKYDIPAMISHILHATKSTKLSYIGHSQGTTVLFSSVLQNPKITKHIDKFIAMAPAVYIRHAQSIVKYLASFSRLIKLVYDVTEKGDFFAHDKLGKLTEVVCPYAAPLCEEVLILLFGKESNLNTSRVPVYMSHIPAGTSTQTMEHWAQQFETHYDEFRFYDYGSAAKNFEHYGKISAPSYDLSKFNVSTYIYYGGRDILVDFTDCKNLLRDLPNVQYSKFLPEYNHIDFVWAYDACSSIYDHILTLL